MATNIFLGEPPANIKQWIIDHATPPGPAGHADTWYKYAGDTEWKTVSISGAISGTSGDFGPPEPTTQIPNVANVVALEIGTDVTSIGINAFRDCSRLTSIIIPNSVTSIGQSAFNGNSGFTSIIIPNSVTSIGWGAFYGCSGLTSVTISNGVTSIDGNVFEECSRLTSVTIPNSVTSIGQYAFIMCSGLTSVTFLGKTLAQVQGMANYSWGISDTSIINVA